MNNALAIRDLQIHSLDVPLAAPFTTSSSALEVLSNVALCIELLSAWLSGHLPLQAGDDLVFQDVLAAPDRRLFNDKKGCPRQ